MSDSPAPQDHAPMPTTFVERTYRATVEELWDLWTTKEGFESWWGPVGFRVEVHALEARTEGPLHYDMIADTPQMIEAMRQMGRPPSHAVHAKFTEVTPFRRLTLVSVIDFLPGITPYESTIVAEFIPQGETVRMAVTLGGMHNAQFNQMQLQGYTSQVSKLDQRFGVVVE